MEQLLGPTSLRQGHEMPVRSIKNLSGGGPRPRRCERATARTRGPAPIHCCGKETACSAPGGHRGWWWAVATGARGFGAAPRTHGAAPGAMPAAANPAPRRNGPPRAFSLIKWHIPGDNFPDSGPWAHAHYEHGLTFMWVTRHDGTCTVIAIRLRRLPRPPGRAPHTLRRVLHPVGLNHGTVVRVQYMNYCITRLLANRIS